MTTSAELITPLTEEEEQKLLDDYCQHYLHMSAADFVAKWRAGAYPDPDKVPGLMRVLMLFPPSAR